MPADFKAFLDLHLVNLAGSVLTPGSILVAAAILFVTFLLASLLGRSTRRLLAAREVLEGVQFAASKMVRYATLLIGAAVAFSSMGFKLDALLAASAVLAVGIGFGLQNVTQNFVSGVILLVEQPVRHGDFVKVGETLGRVDDIGLRATRIVTRDEVTIIVPNSRLISDEVVNHSRPTNQLRMRVSVGVAYGSDTARVRDVLLGVAGAHADVLRTPAPEVRFDDFGDSALKFSLFVWIDDPRADLRVGSELRYAIDAAFRAEALEMPFPQLDLHVRAPAGAVGPSREVERVS
jgi:potassium efflux system protein